jgi:two-component system response regulator VicR
MDVRPRRILIVEDEVPLARMIQWRLQEAGYEVAAVHSGERALRQAAEQRPDLVVLDLKLPDMHGYQVCRELRRVCAPWAVPVLMLTGMDKPIDQLRGFAFGAEAYLTKPFMTGELLDTVAQLLGQLTAA